MSTGERGRREAPPPPVEDGESTVNAAGIAAAGVFGAAEPGELVRLRARVDELEATVEQLQTALYSRILIEQAKGMIAERFEVPMDDAFTLLRSSARSARISLHLLAAAVVTTDRGTPEPILARIRHFERARGAGTR
jgi:ANTAR domain